MTLEPRSIIDGAYLHDLLAQPDTLRAVREGLADFTLDAALLADWRAERFRRVMLTGMGTSLHALYPLHRCLSARGVPSHWIETAELLHGFDALRRSDTLLVAVSQSGESAEIVNLLQHATEFGHVIGVTNNEHSTLSRVAGTTLRLHAGVESTVSCKTYVATLAALHVLGTALGEADAMSALCELEHAERAVRAYLARWREHVAQLLPLLDGITSVFVTGRGDSLATAGTGGLILKESTRQPAEGMSAAAFRHGPLEMAGEQVFVLVFEGGQDVAALNRRLVADITRGGGRAALLTANDAPAGVFRLPVVPAAVQPIVEILPVQMLSLALAARDGFEAGRFERASKITAIA
ncbi:MAG: SIS domain-containing protein [Verrucomicrobiales bacterium]|nr:SIS domain-containing protein [Verrucomicrobiales bacterium]